MNLESAENEYLSYNTEREFLYLPEYGRNVQRMINFAKRLKTKEERNKAALAIIDVMEELNPNLGDQEGDRHKLWTHLFIMSNFEIDIDSPYEIPAIEKLRERPLKMEYPKNSPKYGHFGYYAERIIAEATNVTDVEEKQYLSSVLANLLKKNYLLYHTPNVEDQAILTHLEELSKGKLKLESSETLQSTNMLQRQFGITVKKPAKRKKSKKRRK